MGNLSKWSKRPTSSVTTRQLAALPKAWQDWCTRSSDVNRADNPPQWVTDERAWNRAKTIVKPKWGDYDEPYAVVATIYRNIVESKG